MKAANEMRWIVHPHSYSDSHTEISVIHESEFHAMKSYGWFSNRKIFIYTDSVYGVASSEAKQVMRNYAEQLCERMNAENPVSVDECQQKINEREAYLMQQREFAKNFALDDKLLMERFREAGSKLASNQ